MGLLDMFSPLITMLMFVAYAVYVVLGLVLVVVGIASLTKQLLTSFCIGLIIVGVAMMLVGAGAVYTTKESNWFFMLIILVIDLVLFLVLFSSAVTALFISVGGGDPVDYLFNTHWATVRALDGIAKQGGICYNGMDQDLEVDGQTGQWTQCGALYANDGEDISDACWDGVYGFVGNCSVLEFMMEYEGEADDNTAITESMTMWQLETVIAPFDDNYEAGLTKTDDVDYSGLGGQCTTSTATLENCQACWLECKDNYVQMTKDNMNAAAIAGVSLFFYFVCTAAFNSYCLGIENDDGDFSIEGFNKIILFVLNGLVALFGLIIVVIGVVVLASVNSDCPLEPQASCPTLSILMIVVVGSGILLVAGFVLVGAVIQMKLLIIVANLVFTVLCLALLLVATGLGLAAGVLGEASTQYDDNWEEARDNIRKTGLEEVADFCLDVDGCGSGACDDITVDTPPTCPDDSTATQCVESVNGAYCQAYCCDCSGSDCTIANDKFYCTYYQYDDNWMAILAAGAIDSAPSSGLCSEAEGTTGTCALYGEAGFADNPACCEKSQEGCIEEIEDLVEEYADTFAIVGLIVCVFMLVIIWFSYLAIRIWRGGDDDEDDDD